jgi:lipopolysaccharide/colanic/teichoic acid biosynthesis glycosyltransferase
MPMPWVFVGQLYILFLYIRYLIIVVSLNGGKTCFYEEDRIGCITFNFEIISYKTCFWI